MPKWVPDMREPRECQTRASAAQQQLITAAFVLDLGKEANDLTLRIDKFLRVARHDSHMIA